MLKGTKFALAFTSLPFLMLILALPFVNRLKPFIFGLPFLLFWIVFWVFLTPFILMAAYWADKRFNKNNGKGRS
ncbi:MAG: hypothetical protein A2Y86_06100 [Candidatus Aminicenantes bacterium RBG_13_62_12]|nr:MAG: hypothetical protein A2Y86_06100 [Candidatus Aminicenantes bacterium RBG_13_62_12]